VVLGDDHTLVRQGLKALLASSLSVEAEAEDGRSLVQQVVKLKPDLALVDISMPLLNGLEATRQISAKSPLTRVIVLSMFEQEEYIAGARSAGAWGYVLKEEAPEKLRKAIARVAGGEYAFPDGGDEPAADAMCEGLTPREREILQLIAEGKRNQEIAKILSRSVHTVRNHRARLMAKLHAHCATDLVRAAERMKLVRQAAPVVSK